MTRTAAGILIFGLTLTQSVSACSLSHEQRLALIYKAVQMLSPASTATTPTKGLFLVKAYRYFDNSTSLYVPVEKITVQEYRSWANKQVAWNSARLNDFELRMTNAEIGKDYQVRVDWVDGKSYTWEYTMKPDGTIVTIEEPS